MPTAKSDAGKKAGGKALQNIIARGVKRRCARTLRVLMCLLLAAAFAFPVGVCAAEGTTKTVRVGWYISDSFQEGGEGESKSGYSYDYLRKLADYSDWEYEYVCGEWPELYNKLCSGEIDLMAAVSVSDERRELMLFPDSAMGTDRYYLYKRSDNHDINSNDLSTFDGARVGLVANNHMSKFAEDWLQTNGIDAQVVYYDSFETMDNDLVQGKIDLMPSTSERSINDDRMTPVAFLGKEAYYMAVSRLRPDLLSELNEAITLMDSVDPFVLQTLQYKNFNSTFAKKTVTDEEKAWLSEHPVIKVGYMGNYLPYCATDSDGQATGIVTDVINAAFAALELGTVPEIEFIAYDGYSEIVDALVAGEIDYGFPVDSSLWRLEQDGISASAEVISDRGALFYKTVCEKENVRTLAVNESNVLQRDYTRQTFPDAEIVYYPTIKDCLNAVLTGKADGTIMDTLRVQYVTQQEQYNDLSYVQLSEGTGKCFGVRQGSKDALLLINRGLKLLGSSYGYDSTYKYMHELYSYDTGDFIREHRKEVSFAMLGFVIVIIAMLVLHIRRQHRELAEKEALRREAEAANAAKSTFLFNMSHDIRTPMNAVLGFNGLMLQNLDKPDKLRDYIEKSKVSGEYLLGLINNVLEVARIDSGRETVNEGFADLCDESYCVVFENEVQRKRLTFTREVLVQHRYVFTDAQKVREILLNIVSNAIKYTPDGGQIHLRLRQEQCERAGYGRYVCTVSDTGIGMTEEFQKHVFDTFTREHNSTESKVMGTGLGMAIVKKLVDLMGGTVTVKSKPGEGTTFTVTMEMRLVDDPEEFLRKEQAAESEEDLRLDGRRILLAEDNALNAEIAAALLEGLGASVETAPDGVECIRMLQEHDAGYYDVILMDIQMPNLDGYGAAKKIRALSDPAKSNIPIIAMTANAFDEDRRAALAAGMNGHVSKPIDIKALINAMKDLPG